MTEKLRIVWGARAIGEVIGRSARQTHYLLEQGAIRAARKVGAQWCASLSGLDEQFCRDGKHSDAKHDAASKERGPPYSRRAGL